MHHPVRIRKRLFNRRVVWDWHGDFIEESDGWLVVYHGVGTHTRHQHGQVAESPAPHALSYVSTTSPIYVTAYFDRRGRLDRFKCDAGYPGERNGTNIEFTDLDLDVLVNADLTYDLNNEDLFEQHSSDLNYPDEAVTTAREGIRQSLALIVAHREPFDGSASRTLGTVLAARRTA